MFSQFFLDCNILEIEVLLLNGVEGSMMYALKNMLGPTFVAIIISLQSCNRMGLVGLCILKWNMQDDKMKKIKS